ncbi:hypothetical protein NDU88_001918 [Pleurodeles waltl]|uniref:Uncharacterized protein n=1 Tax=Pleurodeles waltl TaxID=8319 RepID=A0AAV7NC79_PLEWA|nr:hypothetical protein NDU88_001918 [Pleurodeles waltl]
MTPGALAFSRGLRRQWRTLRYCGPIEWPGRRPRGGTRRSGVGAGERVMPGGEKIKKRRSQLKLPRASRMPGACQLMHCMSGTWAGCRILDTAHGLDIPHTRRPEKALKALTQMDSHLMAG